MGSERKPTASMIRPTIFEITSDLNDFIRNAPRGTGIQFARQVLSNLEKRFEYYLDNETLRVATLIDPTVKDILEDDTFYPAASKVLEEKAEETYRSRIRRGLVSPNVSEVLSPPAHEAGTSSTSDIPAQPVAKKTKWKHLQMKSVRNSSGDLDEDDNLIKIKDEARENQDREKLCLSKF
ncbi:Nucleotide-binding protein ZMO1325 [Frankliniella fusca]|uniref:Nucleotide-binding protein ZMO1325 n=1 Tax=Frankliniella fusca TaxID=407009 RepID=A0AAE1HC25_9NEOP|nr:Nucleotide-binding protein ZMO1325 [Frankliniella fusca]